MNIQVKDQIKIARESALNNLSMLNKMEIPLLELAEKFSDTVYVNPFGSSIWIQVDNREDLQYAMTLAPLWKKEYETNYIDYLTEVDGIEVRIRASEGALPDTCKLVEVEEIIPANEERKVIRKVLRCNEVTS